MAVLLPNARLAVRKKAHPFARDAHGSPITGGESATGTYRDSGLFERAVTGAEQGIEWSIRLQPEEWPIEIGDSIVEDGPRIWTVMAANLHAVTGVPDVDYVAITAVLEVPKFP